MCQRVPHGDLVQLPTNDRYWRKADVAPWARTPAVWLAPAHGVVVKLHGWDRSWISRGNFGTNRGLLQGQALEISRHASYPQNLSLAFLASASSGDVLDVKDGRQTGVAGQRAGVTNPRPSSRSRQKSLKGSAETIRRLQEARDGRAAAGNSQKEPGSPSQDGAEPA